jgi:preprotein translocase subunit YajC
MKESLMNMRLVSWLTCLAIVPNFLLFAEEEVAPPRDGGGWQGLVMIAIAFAFFYFILWRPEQKRRREIEAKRSALQKGDRVTAMGIIGTVVRINENTVILKMHDGSQLEFLKAAINEVMPETEPEKSEKTS